MTDLPQSLLIRDTGVSSDWRNRVAVVTGAGGGFGRHLSVALGAAGSSVALVGRNMERLEQALAQVNLAGGRGEIFSCDVSDANAVSSTVTAITSRLGIPDLLVNNVGEGGPIDKIGKLDPSAWWHTFETNLLSSFLCTNTVLPGMVQRGSGTIVNIVSQAGVTRWPTCSAYSVSKCALIKLTENLAAETSRSNISAFAFHPGLLEVGFGESSRFAGIDPSSPHGKILEWCKAQVAAGLATPVETAVAALMHLVSGGYASLSGRYISVDDDVDAMTRHIGSGGAKVDSFQLRLAP